MSALLFRTFDECINEPPKVWAIRGVLALDEDSSWFGLPGSMKSALLTDIAVHLAAGRDWRGHKTKLSGGVIYFAFERAGLTRRRLTAYASRDGVSRLPIAVVDQIIDLIDASCVDIIVATVKAVEERFGIAVALLIFDTYAKGIAAGGGDEDKAQHANIVAANMKRVHEVIPHPIHIATIGHSGWDGKHERGSSAKLGHVDLAVQIGGDNVKTATVVKGNDQPEGVLTSFAMETVVNGVDEDGAPIAVGILSGGTVTAPAKAKPVPFKHVRAIDALTRALQEHGRDMETDTGAIVKGVALEQWKAELKECGVIDRDGANTRTAFARIKNEMVKEKRIDERSGFVWPVQAGGMFSSLFPIPSPPIQPLILSPLPPLPPSLLP